MQISKELETELIKMKDNVTEWQKEHDVKLNAVIEAQDKMIAKNQSIPLGGHSSSTYNLGEEVSKAINNPATLENLKGFMNGDRKSLQIETKDMSLANFTGGSVSLNMAPTGIVGSVSRFFHVRDALPKIQMDNGTLPIIKDNGAVGTFTPVAEGGTKPTIDFNLAETPAKAEVIAGIVNVTRQFLDDLGPRGVMQWMQDRLTEMYLIAEDDQLLNGDGVSPNLKGLNVAGNFTAATSLAADNNVEQLVKTLVQMRTLGRTPRVIVINPTDLSSILLNKSGGSLEFDLPSYVSVNAQGGLSILGVPVVDTQGQTAGQFNVLDTSQMLLGVREAFKIQMFEQDGNNVRTNRITVRAEARIAFANYGAVNNIKGTF